MFILLVICYVLLPVTCFAVACAVVDFEFSLEINLKKISYRLDHMNKKQKQECFTAITLFAFGLFVVLVEQEISNTLTILGIFPYAFTFFPLVIFYIILSLLYYRRKLNKPRLTQHYIKECFKKWIKG